MNKKEKSYILKINQILTGLEIKKAKSQYQIIFFPQ